jgi:hypothetical protein
VVRAQAPTSGYVSVVDDVVVTLGIAAVLSVGTYVLVMRWFRRHGYATPRDLPPRQRRLLWLGLLLALLVTIVCGWAFATGHPAVGIAVLVAFYILPEFVLVPLRIRRSRRAADAARRRRTHGGSSSAP